MHLQYLSFKFYLYIFYCHIDVCNVKRRELVNNYGVERYTELLLSLLYIIFNSYVQDEGTEKDNKKT